MSTACNLSADGSQLSTPPEAVDPGATHSHRAVWEVLVAYGLLQATLWTRGELRWVWAIGVALWIIGVTIYHRPRLQELGLSWTGFGRSVWVVGMGVLAGGAMLLGAHMAGTLHGYVLHRTVLGAAFGYLIWTFEQQFMLQSFFFLRLEPLLGSRKAVWAAAALFAAAHFPNPVLVPSTLVAGLVFCELFRRNRNIYTLAIAQAILGMCLAAAVPESLHHHMRVGIG